MPSNWQARALRAEKLLRALRDRCVAGVTYLREQRELVALVFRVPPLRPWKGAEYLEWAVALLVALAAYAGSAGDTGSKETLLRASSVIDAVLRAQEKSKT
jgi:hypothetical protein